MPLDTSKPVPALQQIGGYDLLNKIAEGGMGAVYKGRSQQSGEIVAIKILPPATAKNPVLLRRFEQEFHAARQLDHPNVVRAIEYNDSGASPFLVMEFVDGESLGQKIERDGVLSEDQSIRIIAQVCQGLHRAHKQKLIHRDVKPDNIMIRVDGVAKLTDLGLVKDADNELNLTKTGRGLGTPNFMAPEQFRNAKNADIRCDIYSLGATLYMMLTGEVPFGKVGPLDCWMRKIRNEFTPPRELNSNISDRVDWAIRRSMSADPEKRPNSCKEFVEDLTGVSIRPPANQDEIVGDVWYLVYRDEDGETHTVKGTTEGIRRALKEGLLGDAVNIRASRTKTGQFQNLRLHPEFRDLVIEPAPMPTGGGTNTHQALPQSNNKPTSTTNKLKTPGGQPARVDPDAIDYANRGTPSSATPTAPKRRYEETTDYRPHIPLSKKQQPENAKGTNFVMWGIIFLIAIAIALAAVMMLPKLKG